MNVSRVHWIFPKHSMFGICCVCVMNIKYIRCNSMGIKYQSHSLSFWLNIWNSLVTRSPKLQIKKINRNISIVIIKLAASSDRFQASCDFRIKFQYWELNHWLNTIIITIRITSTRPHSLRFAPEIPIKECKRWPMHTQRKQTE